MFFLADNNNKTTCNHPGLLVLKTILITSKHRSTLINFINEISQKTLILNQINFRKSSGILRIYHPRLAWSVDILRQEQIILLCKQFEHFKNRPHILTFDGFEFKLLDYDQTYLNSLVDSYLNKDIYIGVPTGIPGDCYIYSTNVASLTLLYDLFVDAYGIMLIYDDIQIALQQPNDHTKFIFNRDIGLQVVDGDHLKIIATITSMKYTIHKDAFFSLIQAYNNHQHASKELFCAKTTIIIDGQSAQLGLID